MDNQAAKEGLSIKLERVRLGVRQYRVAAELGMPQTTLWQIEAGRRAVSTGQAAEILETIRRLAAQPLPELNNGWAA